MGDQKAPDIAQCVHMHLGWEAGALCESTCMSHGYPAPPGPVWIGAYVDDYAQVAVLDDRLPGPWSSVEVSKQADERHQKMLGAYESARIERKVAKATKDQESGTIWGAALDSQSRTVSADPTKRRLLVLATLAVCEAQLVAPAVVQVLVGHWQYHLAFNRTCMCVLDRTYTWLRSSYVGDRVAKKRKWLTRQVRDELMGLCVLAPFLVQHLDTPISECLVATDATTSRGAVVTSRLTSPSQAAFLFQACDRPVSKMEFVPALQRDKLEQDKYVLRLPPLADDAVNSFIRTSQFHVAASYAFKTAAHINRQELLAWLSGLRCYVRQHVKTSTHKRVVCAIDSTVTVNVIRKGRSSSRQLNAVLQRALAMRVIHGVEALPLWVPSAENPSDDPTRNVNLRKASPMDSDMCEQWKCAMRGAQWASVVTDRHWKDDGVEMPLEQQLSARDQWWRMEFDQTYGPGEGPRQAKAAATADLRTRVQPMTEQRYQVRLAQADRWMQDHELPSIGALVTAEAWNALDTAMLALVQHQAPVSYGTWTLAAIQYFYPPTSGHLSRAWLAQRQWGRLAPLKMRPPMPARIAVALAVCAWVLDWRRSSLALLLAFQALLRPAEIAALRRHHIVLPDDLAGSEESLVICITQSKTSHRAARLQSVMVTDPVIVELARKLLQHDAASAPLVRGGLQELYKKFDHLRRMLNIAESPFTLGTLRGGGAVWHIQQCQSLAMLQWRGRWASERSVQHYLQLGLAATAMAALDGATRTKVDALATLAGVLLHPEYNGLQSVQSEQTQIREEQPHARKRVSQFPKDGDGWARE
eukprot:3286630-Amphidinium_carterae.1